MKLENRMEKIENRGIRFPHFFPIYYILFSIFFLLALAPSAQASVILGTANMNVLSNGLIGYWPLDGATTNWTADTTRDLSGQGNTGSLVSMSTTTSPVAGKIGQGLNFNGNTSYINIANSNPYILGTSDITVSMWLKTNSLASAQGLVSKRGTSSPGLNPGWGIRLQGNQVSIEYDDGTANSIAGGTGNFTGKSLSINTWYHVVVTFKHGSVATAYINGNSIGTINISAIGDVTGVRPLLFGMAATFVFPFTGILDDVRIYNRALSAQEVALLYASGQANTGHSAPPPSPSFNLGLTNGLVGYWPFDGATTNWRTNTTSDLSGQGNTGTLVGMSTTSSTVAGKIGQALKFNGTNYISNFASSISPVGSRTVCAWFNTSSTARQGILGTRNAVNGFALAINVTLAGNLTYYLTGGTGITVVAGITTGKWYNACATHDISTATETLYLNGQRLGSQGGATAEVSPAPFNGIIGGEISSSPTFVGTIDDVRIYNRALSAQEVAQLYRIGAANVAHSNTVTLQTGLVGYWTLDGGATNWRTNTTSDLSGQSNTGTLVSMSTSSSPVAGKIGGALKFTGNGNYINISSSNNFPSTAMTISTWIKLSVNKSFNNIINHRWTSVSGSWILYANSLGTVGFGLFDSSQHTITKTGLAVGVWYHVVGVYDGTNMQIYVNGVPGTSAALPGLALDTSAGTTISDAVGVSSMSGTIDDVRIYNRALSYQEVQQLYSMGR